MSHMYLWFPALVQCSVPPGFCTPAPTFFLGSSSPCRFRSIDSSNGLLWRAVGSSCLIPPVDHLARSVVALASYTCAAVLLGLRFYAIPFFSALVAPCLPLSPGLLGFASLRFPSAPPCCLLASMRRFGFLLFLYTVPSTLHILYSFLLTTCSPLLLPCCFVAIPRCSCRLPLPLSMLPCCFLSLFRVLSPLCRSVCFLCPAPRAASAGRIQSAFHVLWHLRALFGYCERFFFPVLFLLDTWSSLSDYSLIHPVVRFSFLLQGESCFR